MVIEPKQTTVAYRCPVCGKGVVSAVGIFSLGGDMLKLKCECKGSELTVVPTSDGKVRLSVPCLACPKPHNFLLNNTVFFGKDLFMLQCPYTDVNICFLGARERVCRELERTELELLDMLGEENLGKMCKAQGKDEEVFTDPQILDIVTFVINDLLESGDIRCNCEGGVCHACDAEVLDDGIRVTCRDCGASTLVPTDSLIRAHDFLNADSLTLD